MSSGRAVRSTVFSPSGVTDFFTHSLEWWTRPRSSPRSACTIT